jgi:hypothetical protein
MQTADFEVAVIISTEILVVAACRLTWFALAARTGIVFCTGIPVVTWLRVGYEVATRRRLARIIGAKVGIVASQSPTGNALPQTTVIARGANIAVVARCLVQRMNTPLRRVATIGGADVVIIASQRQSSGTLAQGTFVAQSTSIAIITIPRLRLELATHLTVAGIRRAGVAIIASEHTGGDATSQGAMVTRCANVPIIARGLSQLVHASQFRQTAIHRAGVAIITVENLRGNALRRFTSITQGAEISITAITVKSHMSASFGNVALICSTRIAIVTRELRTRDTFPISTLVAHRTHIKITARFHVRYIRASAVAIAAIISTWVLVIA